VDSPLALDVSASFMALERRAGFHPKQAFRRSSFALVLAVDKPHRAATAQDAAIVERAFIRILYKKCSIARMGITGQSAGGARRK
jgi:hypothetical protein